MYQNTHQFYITEEFSQNTMGITYKFFSLNMDILTSNDLICRVAMKKKKAQLKLFCLNMSQIVCWMSFLLEPELALFSII